MDTLASGARLEISMIGLFRKFSFSMGGAVGISGDVGCRGIGGGCWSIFLQFFMLNLGTDGTVML